MYKAIDHVGMDTVTQEYFKKNIRIMSGMYGILSPTDTIENYKLPIDTK